VVSTRTEELAAAVWRFVPDPSEAQAVGAAARAAARERDGLLTEAAVPRLRAG
jgi:hypothetical protein